MADIRRVDPTHEKNLHTIWLETLDGSVSIPLTVQGLQGRNPFQISRESIIQTSTQLAQGGTKYDDFEPPFRPIVQEDWSGGRSSEVLEDDKTRYFDSGFVNTEVSGKAFLQGLPTWVNGVKSVQYIDMPGSMSWYALDSAQEKGFASGAITVVSNMEPGLFLFLRYTGEPGNIRLRIWNSVAGEPTSAVSTSTVSYSDIPYQYGQGGIFYVPFVGDTLSAVNDFHVGVEAAAGVVWDENNYWEIGCYSGSGLRYTGLTWASHTQAPYYMLFDIEQSGQDVDKVMRPFEYKGQMYFYSQPRDGSNSFLYWAGYRGAADSNSGDKTKLNDSTQTGWTSTTIPTNSYVMITRGPGSDEEYPYRKITSVASGVLTVDRAWEITHTTDTEYVVLSDYITRNIDLGGRVTDVEIADGKVYFFRGDTQVVLRYEEFNNAGTWTQRTASELVYGTRAVVDHQESGDVFLWVIRNSDKIGHLRVSDTHEVLGSHVYRVAVPHGWGDLYSKVSTLASTGAVWTDYTDSTATQTVSEPDILKFSLSGYSTGDVIAAYCLPVPVDIRNGTHIHTSIKYSGTTPALSMYLHDVPWNEKKFQATSVWRAATPFKLPSSFQLVSKKTTPVSARVEDNAGTSWYDHPNLTLVDRAYQTIPNIDGTSAHLYLAGTDRFNILDVIVGTPNAVGNDLTVKYWDGDSWNTLSITDNTDTGASFATSGTVTWAMPAGWQKGSDDETNLPDDYYWVQLTWSVTPTSTMSIQKIFLQNTERYSTTRQTTVMVNATDADDDTDINAVLYRVESTDWLVFQHSSPFDTLKWDIGSTANSASATFTSGVVEYFDGEQFVAVTNFADTTENLSKTLAVNGSMTWNLPEDMAQININGSTGYTVRMKPSAELTSSIKIDEVAVRNSRHPVYYDLSEAVKGNSSSANTDGDILNMNSGDYLYVGGGRRFDSINVLVDATINNSTSGNGSCEFWDGENWVAVSNYSDGTSDTSPTDTQFAQSGAIVFDTGAILMEPSFVNGVQAYWVRIKSSANHTPALIHGLTLERNAKALVTMSGPTLSAGPWYSLSGAYPYGTSNVKGIDISNVQCISFSLSAAPTWFQFRDDVHLVRMEGSVTTSFGEAERLNNIIMYGEQEQNPWVVTDGALFEIQTQNNNYVARVPIGEMEGLSSHMTGRYIATNDVYLWFNLGNFWHRYYNRTLEHVGYTRDAGLPEDKQGQPSFIVSLPGRLISGVIRKDGASKAGSGSYSSTNFSTVLAHYGQTIHEVFQAPPGMLVEDGAVQNIPGDGTDRLWLSVSSLLCHVPLAKNSLDPTEDSAYRYTHSGYLMTGWITAGFFDIVKLYTKLRAVTRNLSSTVTIDVYYQVDSGNLRTGFTKMTDTLTVSPFDDTTLGSVYASGRKLRLVFVLQTNDNTTSPILEAYVLDTILRLPTANRYSFQCVLGDVEQHQHGARVEWGQYRDGVDIAEQLNAWSDTPVPLRMYSQHELFDDKIVMVEPPGIRPIGPQVRGGRYLYQLTVTEVES